MTTQQWPPGKGFIRFLLCYITGRNTDYNKVLLGKKQWRCNLLQITDAVICKSDLCGKSRCSKVDKGMITDRVLYFPNLDIFDSKMRCHYSFRQYNKHEAGLCQARWGAWRFYAKPPWDQFCRANTADVPVNLQGRVEGATGTESHKNIQMALIVCQFSWIHQWSLSLSASLQSSVSVCSPQTVSLFFSTSAECLHWKFCPRASFFH